MRFLALLLLLAGSSFAQTPEPLAHYGSCWGGLDNYHDSARIDDCDLQDGENFLTDRGYLEKRPGSYSALQSVVAGYPVSYIKEFVTQQNEKELIIHSSTSLLATDFSAAPVVIATINVNGVVDSVSAFNRHFILDGYGSPFYYNGSSVTFLSSMPSCNFIEFAHERLWCANASGFESTLYASAFGDFENWTIVSPLTADGANSFTWDRQDGKQITGLFYSPYGIIVFKRNKMFVLKGVDNDDFDKHRISDRIGCVDDRSIQLVNGAVTWLAEDGIYQWVGGANPPELISREIDQTIKQIRNTSSNADNLAISSQQDWEDGFISQNGAYTWSATITPGSIVSSTSSLIDTDGADFGSGTLVSVTTQTIAGSVALSSYSNSENMGASATWNESLSSGMDFVESNLKFSQIILAGEPGSDAFGTVYISTPSEYSRKRFSPALVSGSGSGYSFSSNIEYFFISSSSSPYSTTGYSLYFHDTDVMEMRRYVSGAISLVSSTTFSSPIDLDVTPSMGIRVYNSGILALSSAPVSIASSFNVILSTLSFSGEASGDDVEVRSSLNPESILFYKSTGSITSRVFDSGFTQPVGGVFEFNDTIPLGSTISYSVRESTASDGGWSAYTLVSTTTSGEFRVPFTKRYWQYNGYFSTDFSTHTPALNSVTMHSVSTGTWDSDILFIGADITSWGQFNAVSIAEPSGVIAYQMRSSGTSFAKDSVSPAWVDQTNGLNISCATGTFAQVRVISLVGSSTDTAQVNSITLNWNEGDSKSAASLFFDGRYLLSVNTSADSAVNDTTLVLQRNRKWSKFTGQSWASLGLFDLQPYAGDGTDASLVWRVLDEDERNDDGTAINAYAVTKDFNFKAPNNDKTLRMFYLESEPPAASVVSMGYSVNKSTTYATTTQAITEGQTFNEEIKKMFPGYAKGKYFNFKFSNAVAGEPMKVDAYTVYGDVNPLYRR